MSECENCGGSGLVEDLVFDRDSSSYVCEGYKTCICMEDGVDELDYSEGDDD